MGIGHRFLARLLHRRSSVPPPPPPLPRTEPSEDWQASPPPGEICASERHYTLDPVSHHFVEMPNQHERPDHREAAGDYPERTTGEVGHGRDNPPRRG